MSMDLEEKIDAYLEGELDDAKARAFELSLSDPEKARAFAEAIMLRDLLAHLPPDHPPWDLIMRLQSSVQDQIGKSPDIKTLRKKTEATRIATIRAVLRGTGWSIKGPAMAFYGVPKVDRRIRKAISIRTIWGSASRLARTLGQVGHRPKRSWWKRAIERTG